jgi:undecaprenyl-diphosphatase
MGDGGRVTSRETLLRLAVMGGVLGFLLILVLVATPHGVIDAAIDFDESVFAFLSLFARRSWALDILIWSIWTQAAWQGGVVMLIVWVWWLTQGETPAGQRKRAVMLSSLVGVYASILLTLVLRAVLPYRASPGLDPASGFTTPYLPDGAKLWVQATSFPSGHAAVLFALAIGLWSVSRPLGLVAGLNSLFVVCLPRVYFGRHWATDILAGAALALATVPVVNGMLRQSTLTPRLLGWSERHTAAFYSVFFLCTLDIAMDFAFAKTALKLVSLLEIGVNIRRVISM